MSTKVEIYTSAWCGYCFRAKALLQSKNIPFEEIAVDGKPELRREMQQRSGRYTVPQIFIGGQAIGGSDDLLRLEATGELDRLLGAASNTA